MKLTEEQNKLFSHYVDLVWEKKDLLNLTSVSNKQEIFERHIADGLKGAEAIASLAKTAACTVADLGTGAGYIGLTIAIALPNAQVTLVESLERRCKFLNWAIMRLGLNNVTVLNERAGERKMTESEKFDFVTERAMGKIEDILPLCLGYKKEKGFFIAYQSEATLPGKEAIPYKLKDGKTRNLVIF